MPSYAVYRPILRHNLPTREPLSGGQLPGARANKPPIDRCESTAIHRRRSLTCDDVDAQFARNSRLTAVSVPRNPRQNSCTRCVTRQLSCIWRPGRAPQRPCRPGIWPVLTWASVPEWSVRLPPSGPTSCPLIHHSPGPYRPQIIRLIEPQKARISLLTHKTTAVYRISGRGGSPNQLRRWRLSPDAVRRRPAHDRAGRVRHANRPRRNRPPSGNR